MPQERDPRRQSHRARKLAKTRPVRKTSRVNGANEVLEAAQLTVGNFLRATRESLKLTQAQVAQRTHESPWQLSRAAVSAIERGQNFPGLEAMLALSNVLDIDPKELLERARLTAVVPVDITGFSDQELESRASQLFWAGDFRRALSVYDAMIEKLALEAPDEQRFVARLATLEVRRATTLKRTGALISAIASAERAIFLSTKNHEIQAEAYVVLADLQVQRGHLPLANDAAERAVALSREAGGKTLTWAFMVQGRARFLAEEYDKARATFEEAWRQAEASGDEHHLTHIAGNIGMCWLGASDPGKAWEWTRRAVELARKQRQPALEASWLVEQGKIAYQEERYNEADRLAEEALCVARPKQHDLTVFRAEWLRHRVLRRTRPEDADRERLTQLRELFSRLDQHEGIEDITDFRETILRTPGGEYR